MIECEEGTIVTSVLAHGQSRARRRAKDLPETGTFWMSDASKSRETETARHADGRR
jgi:hypothetical protein